MAVKRYTEIMADLDRFVREIEDVAIRFGNNNLKYYKDNNKVSVLEGYVKNIREGSTEVAKNALKLKKTMELILDDYGEVFKNINNAKVKEYKINWGKQKEQKINTIYEKTQSLKRIV